MTKTIKYIFTGIGLTLIVACMVISFTAGVNSRKVITCKGAAIAVVDSLENSFVSSKDIRGFLDKEYGGYLGVPVDSIDLTEIERIIDARSAVRKTQAYVTKDGTLHIDVTQRRPVIRFQKSDGGFYADAEGYIFPLQKNYASHVQVIDGLIPLAADSGFKGEIKDKKEQMWFRNIMKIVNYIENSRTWRDKIVQIHVNGDRDLVLIPREGDEFFIFGQPEDIEDKFSKMEKYYTHIIPAKGEGHYKTVDLRFDGQVVCRK